ncbi:MAG: phosphomannomutase/phosphoglucomutase [Lachnospiraceae bacterium]|nr:phosphomannomutase/phosphoglucomutase [Lachnospiraceae bacterium]
MDYKALQNGSDIRGIALEGVEGQHVNLTEEAVKDLSRGFVLWLQKKLGKEKVTVALGRDSRLSGPAILKAASEAMTAEGADVTVFGLASTPAMFMSTVGIDPGFCYDGAVMVTASHLPFNRNGLKFFIRTGGLEGADIKEIIAFAESNAHTGLPAGSCDERAFMPVYSKYLADKIRESAGSDRPLEGLHIIVDAGNGAGGFFASEVLVPLGADIEGSQFLEPDGRFPNHIPNPENKDAMASIQAAVLTTKADLGIIFDTDVDRAGAVLPDGEELNRNRLIAMISAILLRDHPGAVIVTDSVTSTGLANFIREKGGVHHRFKRGYRNVINESIRLNEEGRESVLAMETSGHGALKENYFLDDGAYLMVKLLSEMARGRKEGYELASLIDTLKEPAEAAEFRMPITVPDFKAYGEQVLARLWEYASTKPSWSIAPDNFEGIRVNIGTGWFLLRLSLHEPLMPLNIEGDTPGDIRRIQAELAPFLDGCEGLTVTF